MKDVLDILASAANIAIAATAIWAVFIARHQIGISREVSIREAYEHYHEVLLLYPQFTNRSVQFETFSKEQREQYETFVLYTLMIGERVYMLFPDNRGWHYSIKDDIRLHKDFIGSAYFKDHLEKQDWTTIHFIEEVLAEPDDA